MKQIVINNTTVNINPQRVITISALDGRLHTYRIILNNGMQFDIDDEEFIEELKQAVDEANRGGGKQSGSFDTLTQVSKYFYEANYANIDYEWAKKTIKDKYAGTGSNSINNANDAQGGCSAVRKENLHGRNYDWYYDDTVSFLIRIPRQGTRVTATSDQQDGYRYQSMCVAGGIPELTVDFVASGEYKDVYKALPFLVVDGINEKGLVCNNNVVPTGDKGRNTGSVPVIEKRDEICQMMLVRYILDNFDNALSACQYIKNYVSVYAAASETLDLECHYLISDTNDSYLMEFVNNEVVYYKVGEGSTCAYPAYMTNFYLTDVTLNGEGKVDYTGTGVSPHGSGLERYNLIVDNYSNLNTIGLMHQFLITDLKYTNAYSTTISPVWKTEFVGPTETWGDLTIDRPLSDFQGILEYCRNLYANRSRTGEKNTWQTIHSSVYDMTKKTLEIVIQEGAIESAMTYSLDKIMGLEERIDNLEKSVEDIIVGGDVHVKSIDVDELPKVGHHEMFIISNKTPDIAPDFIGQIWIDTVAGKVYMAVDTTNADSFKALN